VVEHLPSKHETPLPWEGKKNPIKRFWQLQNCKCDVNVTQQSPKKAKIYLKMQRAKTIPTCSVCMCVCERETGLSLGFHSCKADILPLEPHTSSPLCSGYFGDGVSWTICLGWPWTEILLISVSQVARRVTGAWLQHILFLLISILLLYWGCMVTFTKVLTIYLN
jgi:hypothetical protein